jgi:hypothetical protein
MRQEVLIIVFACLAVVLTALPEAQAHGPIQRTIQAAPLRKAVKATAIVTGRVARAAVVVPMQAAKHTAAWFRTHRPLRRAALATARVATAPVRAIRHRRCH